MPTKKKAKTKVVTAKKQISVTNLRDDKQVVSKLPRSGNGLAIVALLFSVLALAAIAYTWYESQVRQVKSNADVAVGVTEIGGQISRLADNTVRVEKSYNELNSKVQPLADKQTVLIESVEKINKSLQKGVNQYLLDQIQQLMIIANNHLLLSNDTTLAVSALKQADSLLDSLSNPEYIPVRQLLAQEIVALEKVNMPDVTGVSAQLTAMSKLIPGLPLQNEPPVTPYTQGPDIKPEAGSYTWKTEILQFFKDLLTIPVSIQKVNQAPKPLLMPEQRYFLNQNMQLKLASAEFAVLKAEQSVFINNIESASIWLKDYFDLDNDRVKKIIDDLQVLEQVKLNPQLPDISSSYKALNEVKGRN